MKILCIESDHIIYKDIKDVLDKKNINYREIKINQNNISEEINYLKREVENYNCDIVFSLDYMPAISLICKLMGKKYISWVVKSYEANLFSCTVLNDCNYIFIPDYSIWDEFYNNGIHTVYYLPFGAHIDRIKAVLLKDKKEGQWDWDISMQQNTLQRENLLNHPFEKNNNPLKDATRGYLEGCIACQYQIHGIHTISDILPNYIKKDLEKNYPMYTSEDNVESVEHYYDHQFFNDIITSSEREMYFSWIAENENFKNSLLCNDFPWSIGEKTTVCPRVNYYEEFPVVAKRSKINLVISHRNWRSAVPQIAWDIMASGGFLVGNYQADYDILLRDHSPITYFNKIQMSDQVLYYIMHDSERNKISTEIKDLVCEQHTLRKRIDEILSIIN